MAPLTRPAQSLPQSCELVEMLPPTGNRNLGCEMSLSQRSEHRAAVPHLQFGFDHS